MLSGFFDNLPKALLISFVYLVGSTGLIIMYKALSLPGNHPAWTFLFCGFFLVILAAVILEILVRL